MSGSRNRRELSRNNQAPTLQFEFPDLHRLPPRERMPVSNRGTCENQIQRIFTNMISWWNDLQVQWGLVRQFETLDMRNMTWLYILSTKPDIRTIQGKLRLWDSALRALDNTQPMSPCGDLFHSATAPCSWQCFEFAQCLACDVCDCSRLRDMLFWDSLHSTSQRYLSSEVCNDTFASWASPKQGIPNIAPTH